MRSTLRASALLLSVICGAGLFAACKSDDAGRSGDGGGASGSDGSSLGGAGGNARPDGGAGGHAGGMSSSGGAIASGGRDALDGSADSGEPVDTGAGDSGPPVTCTAPDKTDTDKDGNPDACDDDDDNDGFVDAVDPAAKDATKPGTFYTPEQILADPHVQDALAAAKASGHEVKTFTQHGAAAISGYYVKPDHEGKMVASGNGANVGNGITGLEIRFEVDSTDHVSEATISYQDGALFGDGTLATGAMLRGENDEFTIYDRHVVRCPMPNQDSVHYSVGIAYARLNRDDGFWLLVRRLNVTVAATGAVTPDCATIYAGDTENVGGWAESEVPRYIPTKLSDLSYMCIDGDVGHVPSETWTSNDGSGCTCTTDITAECTAPDGG